MRIKVDYHSDIPIYKQIVSEVEDAILSKDLNEGDKLPSIRKLAIEANVNPNTVAKSYFVLQAKGYIYSIAGVGYRVAKPPQNSVEERLKELENHMKAIVTKMVNFSMTKEEIKERIFRIVERVIKSGSGDKG